MLSRLPKSTLVPLAFASVYLIWGSTYTAIHVAGETLPPPVVTTARATLSTLLVVVICLLRGKSLRVPRDEMWKLALVGVLFMTVNNTLLTWGETMVPSGYASLVVATTPIMVALIERALPGGDAMNARGWAGTLLGTLGIAVLVWPSLHETRTVTAHYRPGLAIVVLLVAALAFAVGQVLGRRFHLKADTFVASS
ncbi:MAG: EamA family transporter [Acidobacteriota bacterium]